MGQKINPNGFRVGVIRPWSAKWYADKAHYAEYLNEDLRIRAYIEKRLADASVSTIEIERAANRVNVLTGKRVHINVVEIKKPDLDAHLVGENVAQQLENRIAFRRAMRGAMQRVMRAGAKGVKIQVAGRLNGADMSRVESYSDGTVPLHTLRADIDYSWDEARTTYGALGIKTWIYRGEILPTKKGESQNNTKGGK